MKKSWATFWRAEVFFFFFFSWNQLSFYIWKICIVHFLLKHCCNSGFLLLKDKFTQMWKFSHHLTHASMESQGHKTFLELHSVAALPQTAEVDGDMFWHIKIPTLKKNSKRLHTARLALSGIRVSRHWLTRKDVISTLYTLSSSSTVVRQGAFCLAATVKICSFELSVNNIF